MNDGVSSNLETYPEKESCINNSDDSDIFQSARIRRAFCIGDEVDRLFSNHRHYFLLHFGLLFWIVFLYQKIK
jgi:hypothetical protein